MVPCAAPREEEGMMSSCVIRYFGGEDKCFMSCGSPLPTRCQSVAVGEFGHCGEKSSSSSHRSFRDTHWVLR